MKWLILETRAYCPSMAAAPFAFQLNVATRTSKYGCVTYQSWSSGRCGTVSKCKAICIGSYRQSRSTKALRNTIGLRTTMAWQDCTVQMEVDVPLKVAWELWSDREGLNRWMPWIASIKVSKDQPELSQWTLKYNAFGQDFEFSWLARNMQPIHYQKIHWRSVDGLPNRGAVRFYPRGPSSCGVEVTVSFEVPAILSGVASALSPLIERILRSDLERFSSFAKTQQSKASTK